MYFTLKKNNLERIGIIEKKPLFKNLRKTKHFKHFQKTALKQTTVCFKKKLMVCA